MDFTFPYGKYQGRTPLSLTEEDPSYLAWWNLNVCDISQHVDITSLTNDSKEVQQFYLKQMSKEQLEALYHNLAEEFLIRGLDIHKDRQMYSNRYDTPEVISRSLSSHFDSVLEKHHGY